MGVSSIHPDVRVRLNASEAFYGPGVQQLLRLIGETGSLQEACQQMDLSYSKGRKMVKRLEGQLGFAVVERRAGGTGGGGSVLTEQGKLLLDGYEGLAAEVRAFTEQIFSKYMGDVLRASEMACAGNMQKEKDVQPVMGHENTER